MEVPAIIEREPFEAAQAKLKKNQQKTYRNSQYEFLMRGRATCGLCGYACRCVAKKWKTYTYLKYACNPKWSGIPHPETNEVCTLPQMKQDFIDTEVWEWLKRLMNDDMELQKGYQDYLADKETKIEPLRDEMYRIDASLEEFNQKLFKQAQALAVLEDVGSVHAVDVITQDILHIEEMINRYNTRKQEIEVELTSELVSKDFIMDFAGFIATVKKGMQLADNDINLRRKIIEILDVTVILTVENGEPVFYPKCVLKVADGPLLYNDLRTG